MSSKWVDANGNQWRFSAATNTWQALVNGRWVAKPLPAGGLKRGDVDRYKPGTVIVETMGASGASGAPGPMMSVQPLNTKSTPDDDDQFILADSDDFWNLRKISSTDLKSAMLNHVYTTEVSLSNKTLINPRVSDTIRDGAGGSVLKIEGASGSVNHLAVRSSATGNAVGLTATGSDAAINIAIDPKGAGQVLLGGVPAVTTTGTQTLTNKSLIGPSLTNPVLGDTTLSRSAAGVLAVDGNPVSVRVPVPSTLTSAGKPGYWAADGTCHYAYSGDGATHSWTKSGMSSRTASLVVAAANSPATSRAGADYICDGTDDHLTINAAIAALPANGGRIVLMEGDYVCPGAIEVDRDNVLIEGQGHGYATVIGVGAGTVNRTAAIVAGVTKKVWHFGLKNLFINVSGGTQAIKAGTGHGVVVTGDFFNLDNVTVQYCEGDAFHFGQDLIDPGEDVANTTISEEGDGYLLSQTSYPDKDVVEVVSTTGFSDTGFGEFIIRKATGEFIYCTYTGLTSTSFTGVVANYGGVDALELAEGDIVYQTEQTYNGKADTCFAYGFGGNGFHIDWHFSSCEFYLCRVQGTLLPSTEMGDQHGFYVQGTLLKFHLCHPYFLSGFGLKVGDKYSFTSGGIRVHGGEWETCARGGIQILKNNIACLVEGANFYDNGVAHEGSPWHATDIELGYFSKECKVSECLFFDGPKANVQGKNIYIIGGTNHTIEQNFFRSPGGTEFGGWSVDNVYVNGADTTFGANSRITVRNNVMTNYNSGSAGVRITGASTNCLVESNTTDAKLIEEVASSTTPNSNGFLNNTLIPGQGAVITVLGGNSVKRDVRDVVTTINGASGAVTGIATLAGTETLTNKTFSLASNTLTGTLAQFNTALTDGDFATIAGVQTLTNKTLTSPTITGASITGSSVTGATALSMGSTTLTGTATPLFLSLGGTYGTNTAGSPANLKLKVHEDPSAAFGLGVSASNLEYQVPLSGYAHRFYAGGTEVAAITSAGITASGVAVPTVSSTSTFTNKSLSGSTNTFTNIPQSAVTGLTSDLAARELVANKGQANGYASLDSGGKVPVTQLPHSIMQYQGTWNAATNTPALADGSGDTGDVYRVTVGGSRNLGSGSITFDVGDYAIYNGTAWEKSDTTDAVASVNGYTGNVSLAKGDVGLGNVDNTSDATKNAASATLTNKTVNLSSNTLTGTRAQFNTALSDDDFATLAGTETLTNKTLTMPRVDSLRDTNGADSIVLSTLYSRIYLSPVGRSAVQVIADANAVNYLQFIGRATGNKPAISAGGSDANVSLNLTTQGTGTVQANGVDIVTLSGTQSLTNKTLNLGSNTLTGTVSQFNTALSDGDFVTLAGSETLTNKTLASPVITSPTGNVVTSIDGASGGVSGFARLVRSTGSTVSGQWARVLTFSAPASPYILNQLTFAVSAFAHQSVIVSVNMGTTSANNVAASVEIIARGTNTVVADDAFKVVNDGYGSPFELWVRASGSGSILTFYEINRRNSSYLTYDTSTTWTVTEPTGTSLNVFSTLTGVTTTGTQTLTNKTLTSPRVNQLLDTNGATGFVVNPTASAVNYLEVRNAATGSFAAGSGVVIAAAGADVDVNLLARPRGNGYVGVQSANSTWIAKFMQGASNVNHWQIAGSATGNPLALTASGTDTNIGINLISKGSGTVQANGVPVVTTTGAQAVQNKTLDSTNTSTQWIKRDIATVTAPTALGSTAATDYVTFANMRRTVALLHCEGSDASTTVVDSSNVGANWTCVGDAQIDTDQFKFGSSSLKFDGTGDYITPTAAAENFAFGTGDFTIEMWIRPSTIAGANRIFYDARPLNDLGVYPVIYLTSAGLPIFYTNGSARIAGTALSTNTWYHVAVSRSSGTTRMFVDGTQVGSSYTDANSYLSSSDRPRIGANGHSNDTNNFIGHMDEINIVNGFAKYASNFTPPDAPLDNITEPVSTAGSTVALLHCNGANNSTVITDSGVLLSNWTAAGNAQISTAQSKFGGSSLVFDGTGDYITPTADSSNFAFGTGDFTIEMWIRPATVSVEKILLDARPAATNGAYALLGVLASGMLYYYVNSATRITSASALSVDTWHHVALCRSGTSTKLFQDGTQVGSTWTDTTDYLGATSRPNIGASRSGSDTFAGYMDEIRISKGVARYTSNFTPPTAPHPDPPTIKLPTAVGNSNRYTVCCVGPQSVLLSNGQGQTINGGGTVVIEQDESLDSVSTGAVWRLV